ncbi:MAG: hypothetical protein QOF98_2744 [Streptomyces sp.]|nr:hypothetical protein [Streptomyces sp.]
MRVQLRKRGRESRRTARSGLTSVAVVLAVGAGLLSGTAATAVATTPTTTTASAADVALPSVTLPGADRAAPRQAYLYTADDSGYLSAPTYYDQTTTSAWIGDDGSVKTGLPTPIAVNGGYGLERVGTTSSYRIRHYATGEVTQFDLPAGDTYTGIFAENLLVTARQTNGKWTLHQWEIPAGGGQPVDRPVTGVPAGFAYLYEPSSDATGAAFWYKQAGGAAPWGTLLLDFATAEVTTVPSQERGFALLEWPHLSGDKVSFVAIDTAWNVVGVYVVNRDRPADPGVLVDGVGDSQETLSVQPLGDWVVYPEPGSNTIVARLAAGGPVRTLLPTSRRASTATFATAQDGSLYIEGGSDAQHWAVQHITLAADGTPTVAPAVPLPAVSVYEAGGIAVDQGRVLIASEDPDATSVNEGTHLTGSALTLKSDGTLSAAPPAELGDLGYDVPGDDTGDPGSDGYHQTCYDDCLRLTGTGESSVAHVRYDVPAVVAAAGPYLVIRPTPNTVEVRGYDDKKLTTGSWPTAALWGSTLWTPGSTTGTVAAVSLPSLKAVGTVSVGATCALTDLQVVGRWIYWSCGPDGDAGVYDQTTKQLIDVPSGYAELADGYLVNQDDAAGKLRITYFPGAVPADQVGTSELGPLPNPLFGPADERGRFWAVDRFGGAAAYLTDSGDVTVKWPQVTTSKLAVIAAQVPAIANFRTDYVISASWNLSKPAAGWTVTISKASGKVVHTESGGPARGNVSIGWSGESTNSGRVASGSYRWTLTALAADRPGEKATATGALTVLTAERHDFGTDGIGDVVTMDTAGRLAIQPGDGQGGIDSAHKLLAGGWPASSYPIPFGDRTRDGCNELLIRTPTGDLVSYYAPCGTAITPNTSHRTIETGFGGFNVLTSPGDVTGDGESDLVTRTTAGDLRVYPADGEGEFGDPATVATGQGKYTRIVGAGDLNGDDLGDLVAVDGDGLVWRLLANGKGGFAPRTQIGSGFSAYNIFAVPGDLTGDGQPDLVARDTAGNLWRWTGTSAGLFTGRTQIGTGWGGYLYLT